MADTASEPKKRSREDEPEPSNKDKSKKRRDDKPRRDEVRNYGPNNDSFLLDDERMRQLCTERPSDKLLISK